MTNSERSPETGPAPTLPEQIAAVEECLEIARGVLNNVLRAPGGFNRPSFADLNETYQHRIECLEAALATLRATSR